MKTCSLWGLLAHSSPRWDSACLKGIKKASEPKFKHEPVGKCTLWEGILSEGLKAELALKVLCHRQGRRLESICLLVSESYKGL